MSFSIRRLLVSKPSTTRCAPPLAASWCRTLRRTGRLNPRPGSSSHLREYRRFARLHRGQVRPRRHPHRFADGAPHRLDHTQDVLATVYGDRSAVGVAVKAGGHRDPTSATEFVHYVGGISTQAPPSSSPSMTASKSLTSPTMSSERTTHAFWIDCSVQRPGRTVTIPKDGQGDPVCHTTSSWSRCHSGSSSAGVVGRRWGRGLTLRAETGAGHRLGLVGSDRRRSWATSARRGGPAQRGQTACASAAGGGGMPGGDRRRC